MINVIYLSFRSQIHSSYKFCSFCIKIKGYMWIQKFVQNGFITITAKKNEILFPVDVSKDGGCVSNVGSVSKLPGDHQNIKPKDNLVKPLRKWLVPPCALKWNQVKPQPIYFVYWKTTPKHGCIKIMLYGNGCTSSLCCIDRCWQNRFSNKSHRYSSFIAYIAVSLNLIFWWFSRVLFEVFFFILDGIKAI